MKVRIKSGDCPSYFSFDELYQPIGIESHDEYWVVDDNGKDRCISIPSCRHLNGGSWEIVDD